MKSRFWLNLVLLLIVLSLVAIVFYTPGLETDNKPEPLTLLKPDEINHVYITRKYGKIIELKKINNQWWLYKPVIMPADRFHVDSLLKLVETSIHSKHDLRLLEVKTYGLDSPRATITFNRDTTIQFGASEPLHKYRYLRVANNLYTTDDFFYYQLAADFSRYLDPAILPADSSINKLSIPGSLLELKSGLWHRTSKNVPPSADANVELLDAWKNAAALKVELIEKFNHLKANVVINLKDKKTPLTMHYHSENDQHYLTRLDNGLRYTLPEDVAISLALRPKNEPEESSAKNVKVID